jgi:hypothetical protein
MKTIEQYLEIIPTLQFSEVTDSIWEVIQDEGLDEEFDSPNKDSWHFSTLPLDEEDIQGLKVFDTESIEKFNLFDIELKNKFNLKIIDLIDYTNGQVRLVKRV